MTVSNEERKRQKARESNNSKIRLIVDALLRKLVFNGSFKERKFVQALNEYRDVVVIHSSETIFIEKLQKALNFTRKVEPRLHWIGITDTNDCESNNVVESKYQLWIKSMDDLPLGDYQFCVTSVNWSPIEFSTTLQCFRKLEAQDYKSSSNFNFNIPVDSLMKSCLEAVEPHFRYFLSELTTLNNWKTSAQFCFALILAIFAFAAQCLYYFSEFLLKLIKEIAHLIEVLQPTIFAVLNVVNNAFYGFFTTILFLFKSNPSPVFQRPPLNQHQIGYYKPRRSFQ